MRASHGSPAQGELSAEPTEGSPDNRPRGVPRSLRHGGACGCCTVIKDGEAVPSCSLLTVDCDGSEITTLEGLADRETGELSKVQQAFLDYNAFQCGFCTPGIIMTTTALLDKNPNPTQEEVRDALSGNYCRCISQYHVMEAIDSLTGRGVELDEKWEAGDEALRQRELYAGELPLCGPRERPAQGRARDSRRGHRAHRRGVRVLPAVTSGIEAVKDGAPQLYPGMFEHNIVTPGYPPFQKDGAFWHLVKGDPEKGFEECAYIAEDTVEFSKMAAPASPEPPGAIVRWEGGKDFTVWCDTQSGYICKITNASVIEGCNMDIHTFNVGGSYGNKQSQVQIVSSAAVLSMKTGRPVKYYQTKTEQMCCFETRLGSQVHAKIGMDKDGVVKAVKAEWTVDTGCLSNATQGQIGVGIGEAQLVMCKCPNWDLDTNLVVTNKQPAGIVRGYGGEVRLEGQVEGLGRAHLDERGRQEGARRRLRHHRQRGHRRG